LLPIRLPAAGAVWLYNEVPPVRLSVAWLERGASARPLVRNQACLPWPVRYAEQEGEFVAAVVIGIDPHKSSHTAVVVWASEEQQLGKLRVRACAEQAQQSLAWAAAWPERTWAVEGARGLGHMLAQQLVAAGERMLDVQPKLAARVRLLASGDINKNDPNDARSVAIAALRSAACPEVQPDDQAAVLKVWSKRHRDLGRLRTQAACRLHAVLCELVPGGVQKEITAAHAARILEAVQPAGGRRPGPPGTRRRLPGGPAPH
jgi:hypothetical protein